MSLNHIPGLLLRDLQTRVSPTTELVGTDIMPSFLQVAEQHEGGNIRYVLHDINEPFPQDFQGHFDLTHVRVMLAAAAQTGLKAAVRNLIDTVAPGGWLQVQEVDTAEDDPAYSPTTKDFITLLRGLFSMIGLGPDFCAELEGLFREAGLEEVSSQKIELPLGKRLGDNRQARASIDVFKFTIQSLTSVVTSEFESSQRR